MATTTGTRTTADLAAVFADAKAMLEKHSPPFVSRDDAKGGYHLWSERPVTIEGRKRSEVYFAGVVPQKGYVGLYYMPVYAEPEVKAFFAPELLGTLKGKSCFHLKSLDRTLAKQIRDALKSGLKLYKQRGWV